MEIMLKNKCCLYVIISIRFFSITICNLLIEFPSYLSSVDCVALQPFPTLSHKPQYFQKKKIIEREMLRFSLQLLSETFLILRRIQRYITINVQTLLIKFPLFLSYFNETWIFSRDFTKNTQVTNLMMILPVRG